MEAERILAIDYGKKRIGIAVSDPLNLFAIPLVTLSNDNKFFNELGKIISEKNVGKIVLGFPEKEDGAKRPLPEKLKNSRRHWKRKQGW